MKRDQEQLNNVAGQFDRKAHHHHPGLGMILLVFNDIEREQGSTPISIVLRGVKPEDAIRMLREHADLIEKVEKGEPMIVAPGPLVIKSSGIN